MGAGAQLDVAVTQPSQFRYPKTGLSSDAEQSVISPPGPGVPVGCCDDGIELGADQKADFGPLAAFGGYGQHSGDELGVLGVAQGAIVKERADGGQAGVSGAGTVVTFLLEVIQEGADGGGIEIGQVQPGWLFCLSGHTGSAAATARRPLGSDGAVSRMSFVDQPLGEEHLLRVGARRSCSHHHGTRLAAQRPSRSRFAVGRMYQYVVACSALTRTSTAGLTRLDVEALTMPAEQGVHGQRVAEVVQPATATIGAGLESSLADQTSEDISGRSG